MIWAQRQRIEIINWIKALIIEANQKKIGIDKQKLISEICMTKGASRKKAEEYIQDIKGSGFIEEDSAGLWLSSKYIPKEEIKEEIDIDKILDLKDEKI